MSEDDPEVTEALHRLTRIMNHVHEQDLLKVGFMGWGDATKNLMGSDVNPETYVFPENMPEGSYKMGETTVQSVKDEIDVLLKNNIAEVEKRNIANNTKKECNEKITSNNVALRAKIQWIKSAIDWKKTHPQ